MTGKRKIFDTTAVGVVCCFAAALFGCIFSIQFFGRQASCQQAEEKYGSYQLIIHDLSFENANEIAEDFLLSEYEIFSQLIYQQENTVSRTIYARAPYCSLSGSYLLAGHFPDNPKEVLIDAQIAAKNGETYSSFVGKKIMILGEEYTVSGVTKETDFIADIPANTYIFPASPDAPDEAFSIVLRSNLRNPALLALYLSVKYDIPINIITYNQNVLMGAGLNAWHFPTSAPRFCESAILLFALLLFSTVIAVVAGRANGAKKPGRILLISMLPFVIGMLAGLLVPFVVFSIKISGILYFLFCALVIYTAAAVLYAMQLGLAALLKKMADRQRRVNATLLVCCACVVICSSIYCMTDFFPNAASRAAEAGYSYRLEMTYPVQDDTTALQSRIQKKILDENDLFEADELKFIYESFDLPKEKLSVSYQRYFSVLSTDNGTQLSNPSSQNVRALGVLLTAEEKTLRAFCGANGAQAPLAEGECAVVRQMGGNKDYGFLFDISAGDTIGLYVDNLKAMPGFPGMEQMTVKTTYDSISVYSDLLMYMPAVFVNGKTFEQSAENTDVYQVILLRKAAEAQQVNTYLSDIAGISYMNLLQEAQIIQGETIIFSLQTGALLLITVLLVCVLWRKKVDKTEGKKDGIWMILFLLFIFLLTLSCTYLLYLLHSKGNIAIPYQYPWDAYLIVCLLLIVIRLWRSRRQANKIKDNGEEI